MTEEFCFAIRCRGSGQRPAFKRKCSQCVSHAYLDQSSHVPTNGLGWSSLKEYGTIATSSNQFLLGYREDYLVVPDQHSEILQNEVLSENTFV